MPRRRTPQKLPPVGRPGPIKPGSVFYRVLQMIAREVARAWENQLSANDQQRSRH